MRKYLLILFVLSTAVLLLNHPKPEKVIRTEGSKLVFESGNYAIVYPFGLHRIPSNPLGLRTYEKFTFEDKKIEQGLYDNNGEFFPDDDIRLKNNSFFFYIIMTIMAIYFTFFFYRDFINARDWFHSRTDIAFTAMLPEKRNVALKNKMSCDRCNTSPNFSADKELRVQGMIWIEGKCNICGEQKKIRIK